MEASSRRVTKEILVDLAVTADQQSRHLAEVTRWAFDSGVEENLTDYQVLQLQRHQAALSTLLLALANERTNKR